VLKRMKLATSDNRLRELQSLLHIIFA